MSPSFYPTHKMVAATPKTRGLVLLAIEPPVVCLYILIMSAKFTTVKFYNIEPSRTITRRTDAPEVEVAFSSESAKPFLPGQISLNMRRPASARYPSWTRWRPRTPQEIGFAASSSRPTPVGRPRQPVPSQLTAVAAAKHRAGVRRPARAGR